SAGELELHEAALLAGLPQLPAIIDPLNPDPAIQAQVIGRQYLVLDLMVKEGYITEEEAAVAKSRTLNYVSPDVPLEAPHFTLYAVEQLEDLLAALGKPPEFLADGGLRVYTSVDLEWQDIAQNAAESNVARLRDAHHLTNASVVIIHPPSGEILAMVGSVDYNNDAIDGQVNVSVAQRQPGSTMKPFTYAAALELGWTPGTILWDVETAFPNQGQADYAPQNYDRRFHGPVHLRDALANSYNIPAVKTLDFVSVEYLISFLQRMGTQSLVYEPGRYGLSLTLGGGEITLLEMTSNYATFARSGEYVAPRAILCIIDRDDNIIYQYENRCPEGNLTNQTRSESVQATPVVDPRIAFIISDILSDNGARTPAMGANSPLNTGS
ncbi:MAG TPA: penicillin-binding transpeptidase domain-containing protein, partial [Aggregatilineales bacterium]|nr:penicillin-binding transpeptidase domain-containing protein [Aggregatilineales bacterium]